MSVSFFGSAKPHSLVMSSRTIVKVRKIKKPATSFAPSASSTGPDVLESSFGDGPGSKFASAAKRIWQGGIDPSQFLNDSVYGNLLFVDKKRLKMKRDATSESLGKIVAAIAWILQNEEKESGEAETYKATRDRAGSVIGEWRKVIASHPHRWPRSPIFGYVMELRELILSVDKATGCSLSQNIIERFTAWSEREKTFLPSASTSSPPHCFIGLNLRDAFPYMRDLYTCSSTVVTEFCTPPYAWSVEIARNIKGLLQKASFEVTGMGESIREWAHQEIYKEYLSKIGVIEYKIDFMRLIPRLGRTANMSTATEIMRGMLQRKDAASKVFGAEAVKDLGDMYEEARKRGEAFTDVEDRVPPIAVDSPFPSASDLPMTKTVEKDSTSSTSTDEPAPSASADMEGTD